MSLKCGIVGLPNVGKSTIFNALTNAGAASANYPFCTIDPNFGVVEVPDKRLWKLAEVVKPKNVVPTYMEFVDIAGLVEGAHKGEGLGNQFLSHIRETHAIAHVVRCFDDPNIIHVKGKVDPLYDIQVIHLELILADLESLEKQLQKLERKIKGNDKEAKAKYELGKKFYSVLEQEKKARTLISDLTEEEIRLARDFHLLTWKPEIYVLNVDEGSISNGNEMTQKVIEKAIKENTEFVIVCGKIEEELSVLSKEERKEYLESLGVQESGLEKFILASYRLLDLITFFTAGEQEVRAWTVKKGTNAKDAAGEIHSDIAKGFIKAEVISYSDFEEFGSLQKAKEAGKLRFGGKDYPIQDGDICYFRFHAG
ncbi:MAG: redox-regulated ATPase YchF [Leptospiraceae bacterium]|nr:redox-regulated ATPase YchF [Leptospiraceae bacterium]MDW7975574.1 redox-regulated ATPase YchF [Leptospiraceae bacterium]